MGYECIVSYTSIPKIADQTISNHDFVTTVTNMTIAGQRLSIHVPTNT
jgi:hypothetical protein